MLAKDVLARSVRVVLVEPSHPGNIGAVARAMKTTGIEDLVLVNPELFPDPRARWRAMGGADLLEVARVVSTLEGAIEDCTLALGTSARHTSIPWPVLGPRAAAQEVLKEGVRPGGRTAIVFGREATGLRTRELNLCQRHLRIPANPEYSSLNIAMAVQVVCYEIFVAAEQHVAAPSGSEAHTLSQSKGGSRVVADEWDRPPASIKDIEAFYGHLEETLTELGFHDRDNPRQLMTRLRRLVSRVRPDDKEISILRGILSAILRR